MSSDDNEYFRERATVERALAKAASEPHAAAAHEELARGYDALVKREEQLELAWPTVPRGDAAAAERSDAGA